MVIVYFVLGFVREALVTMYYRAVSQQLVFGASGVSIILTLLDIFVIAKIIQSKKGNKGIWLAICYALGEGVGTFVVMTFKPW